MKKMILCAVCVLSSGPLLALPRGIVQAEKTSQALCYVQKSQVKVAEYNLHIERRKKVRACIGNCCNTVKNALQDEPIRNGIVGSICIAALMVPLLICTLVTG